MSEIRVPLQFTTERLVIRKYYESDGFHLYNLIEENKKRLIRSFPKSVGLITNVEKAEKIIRQWHEDWQLHMQFYYGLWDLDGNHVGQISIKNIEWNIPKAELGYYVCGNREGNGYMAEGLKATIKTAFEVLSIKKLYLRILPENHRSEKLATKCGFIKEGIHRKEFLASDHTLEDMIYYGMTDEDFFKIKANRSSNNIST